MVKYFTDPNAIEPPDMQLLFPFVDSALPLAYGVLGVQLFHVILISYSFLLVLILIEQWSLGDKRKRESILDQDLYCCEVCKKYSILLLLLLKTIGNLK